MEFVGGASSSANVCRCLIVHSVKGAIERNGCMHLELSNMDSIPKSDAEPLDNT